LNQYTQRTVPGYVTALGSANSAATVSLWANNDSWAQTIRQGNYFAGELPVNNSAAATWLTLTNLAVLNNGTNADIVTNIVGAKFVTKTPEVFAFDADGNLRSDGRWSYTWDGENRLVNMTSLNSAPAGSRLKLDFSYDYQSRRIQKVVSWWNGSTLVPEVTTLFAYDGSNLVAESAPNSPLRAYLWGVDLSGSLQGAGGVGGLLVLSEISNRQISASQFACYDGNGNVMALINANDGTMSGQYEYGPFGEVIRTTCPMAETNPFRFSTKYLDHETDLLYYGYRYYGASTGRWLGRDPIEEDGGINLFDFVGNSPLSRADALGLKWQINRNGGDRAIVSCESGDTVWDLAKIIGLDPGEYKTWLKAKDGGELPRTTLDPLKCNRSFDVPNKVVIVISGDINWLAYDIIILRAMELHEAAEHDGYSVRFMDYGASSFTKADVLAQKQDLHGFMFFGHGEVSIPIISPSDTPGQFVIEKVTWQEIAAPEMIANNYHYGVVLAKFCSSSVGHWDSDASFNGLGEVTLGTVTTPVMPPLQVWRLKRALEREAGKGDK
jgi:RHS repeat-associated protein